MLGLYNAAVLSNERAMTPSNAKILSSQFQQFMQRVLKSAQQAEDLQRQQEAVARLIGFIRVLDRPPAFGLPLFTSARENAPPKDLFVAQEIDAEDRISAFVPFDPEDLEIIPVEIDLKKAPGDNCVLVYEIDYGQVLVGDHSNLREQLLSHLGDAMFVQNSFSFHQAARFCRSEPAIHEAIRHMQLKLTDAPQTSRYIHNVLIRDEITARARAEIPNCTSSVEFQGRLRQIIAETIDARYPEFAGDLERMTEILQSFAKTVEPLGPFRLPPLITGPESKT